MPVLYAERHAHDIRYRLEVGPHGLGEPVQEEFIHRLDVPSVLALERTVDALLRSAASRRFADEARVRGALLYRALVPERLREQLDRIGGPLLVSTSLSGVPWELFHDGREFWGLRYALGKRLITERPAPAVGTAISRARPRALVIGSDARGDLPFVQEEIERICDALDPVADLRCLGGPTASFEAVTASLGGGFDLIHYCGHVVRTREGGPALLLAGERSLPAAVIEASLTGRPVVFVNGCASVRGRGEDPGDPWEDDFSSVAHGFLFGGALGVVGTVCAVSDGHAAALATEFYRRVLAGAPMGEALRRARLQCRDEDPRSPTWLSFVLYGNPAQVVLDGNAPAVEDPPHETAAAAPASVATRGAVGPTRIRRLPLVVALAVVLAAVGYYLVAARGVVGIGPLVVGVMDFHAEGEVPDWMRRVARDGLNTVLSKVPTLRVYSRQKIDFVREKRGLSEIEAAELLGITRMITGTVSLAGSTVTLEAEVVDIGTGLLEATERVEGPPDRLIELQNGLALRILHGLRVPLPPAEIERIFAKRTNEALDAYRLLTEAIGGGTGTQTVPEPAEPPPAPEPTSRWPALVAAAYAQEPSPDERAVRALLESYRAASQAADVGRLAALHVALSAEQRTAFARYFENARGLTVQLSDFDILIDGHDALATFTRADAFTDVRSGRAVQVEIRMSTVLSKEDGAWKIRGLKDP